MDSRNIVPAYLRRRSKRGLKEGAARTRYLTDSEELSLLQAASPDVRPSNDSGDQYRATS